MLISQWPSSGLQVKPSPAKRHWDIGNWELLAVKLALEEWRYWLEHPIHDLHRPQELGVHQSTKRQDSQKASWAISFDSRTTGVHLDRIKFHRKTHLRH